MIGWLIITTILIIITVVVGIIEPKSNDNTAKWINIFMTMIFLVIVAIFITFFGTIGHIQITKTQTQYKTMIEETYDEGSVIDTESVLKIIDYNKWLEQAQHVNSTQGIFSFYKDEVQDLEYIKIETTIVK